MRKKHPPVTLADAPYFKYTSSKYPMNTNIRSSPSFIENVTFSARSAISFSNANISSHSRSCSHATIKNGTSYRYKVPNLPFFASNYHSCQLDLQISSLSTHPTHFTSCQLNPPPFFHVDMFPLTANFSFSGRVAPCPKSASPRKSLVFKPFSYIYFSTFDINTTIST